MDKRLAETVGQTVIDGNLRWYRCGVDDSGVPFEEDGIGFSPEFIRRKLIEEEGKWDVIADDSVNKSAVVRKMRELIQMDMASAAKLLKSLPGVIYTGTKTEAKWIKEKTGMPLQIKPATIASTVE